MKISFPLAITFLLVLFSRGQTIGDLDSDRQALLRFASAFPHNPRLNWNSSTEVCTSWIGITCNKNESRVFAVRLPGVGLHGPITTNTLGKLDALNTLSLRSNQLNGVLPSDLLSVPSLHYVYVQHNNISGAIPFNLSPQIVTLDLSFNSFSGGIPSTIQYLVNLKSLSLQNNTLTGSLPDLNVTRLKQLNLSYNHLNGPIPSDLQKFPFSSFEGNNMLCGPPLYQCSSFTTTSPSLSPTYLPASPTVLLKPSDESEKKLTRGHIIAIATGSSAGMLFLLLVIFVYCAKKKNGTNKGLLRSEGARNEKPKEDFGSGVQEAEKNKLVFFGGSYNFDLEDLLRASAEVLGKGNYGTTYKAILEEGTTVVVKRLRELAVGKREFEQQMETAGRIGQHPNVLPLLAYYYSKDEKLLVYDYIAAGSFSTLLHGNREIGRPALDWESRVKICLEAAKGIAHIHSAGGGRYIHGNIKASNVLITPDFHGCISDFGLVSLMSYPTVSSRGAGYRAPEVNQARKSTQKSDVYSFGVLLLEMLTGKSPVPTQWHDDAVDLPRWVQSVVREEWTAEVFDLELVRRQDIQEEMVQMLQTSMTCMSRMPDSRPTMEEVIRMIKEVRPSDSEDRPSSDDHSRYNAQNSPINRPSLQVI